MVLKKWQFGTPMGEQIEAQNANITEIDTNITEIDTKITEIDANLDELDASIKALQKLTSIKSVNSLDMNNVKDFGFYFGYNMENARWKNISTFIVIPYAVNWVTQIQFNTGVLEPKIAIRNYNGTDIAWTAWREI